MREITAEEHFIAHKLLAKIHPNHYGIIKAVICMGMNSKTHERHVNKSYAWERRKMAELQSGEGNPFYGKHHTEEHKQYMSKLMKSRPITWGNKISKTKRMNPTKWTEEAKRLHSINQSGEKNSQFGMMWIHSLDEKVSDHFSLNFV
uniref:Homing endonuclease n=1 Tax=Escherichia phage UFV-AREG1 TaxID=1837867 RepID=A0A173GAE0_9CAUD